MISNIWVNYKRNLSKIANIQTMKLIFFSKDVSTHLMITPLTEKCFLNLTSALNSVKFGCLAGPNSSGKRQTINLLAQVF